MDDHPADRAPVRWSRGTTCSSNMIFISDGHARQAGDDRPARSSSRSRARCRPRLGSGSAPSGQQGLDPVPLGHRAGCAGRTSPRSPRATPASSTSGTPADLGQGLAGQVVLGRARARRSSRTRSARSTATPEGRDVLVEVVAERRVEVDRDAQRAERAAEPLAVRVEPLAARPARCRSR